METILIIAPLSQFSSQLSGIIFTFVFAIFIYLTASSFITQHQTALFHLTDDPSEIVDRSTKDPDQVKNLLEITKPLRAELSVGKLPLVRSKPEK